MLQLVVRHELNGGVRCDAQKGGRVALEESQDAVLAVDLRAGVERAAPGACPQYLARVINVREVEWKGNKGRQGRERGRERGKDERTGVFAKVGVGRLEEDLDSVERCDDRLCLHLHCQQTDFAQREREHEGRERTTQPAKPPASPDRRM